MLEKLLFKKIELWFVLILLILGILGTIFFGYLVWYKTKGGPRFPELGAAMVNVAKLPHTTIKIFENLIQGKSDLEIEDRFDGQQGFSFSSDAAQDRPLGYLLLNRNDGDRDRSVSELVDLDSKQVIHTWIYEVDPIWAELDHESSLVDLKVDAQSERFRGYHAILLEDGSIVTHDTSPLLRFDLCGKLIWLQDRDLFHHSIEMDHEGNIWVPTHIEPKTVPIGLPTNFYDDGITQISREGEVLFHKSMIQVLDENGLGALVFGGGEAIADPIHLNDIEPVQTDGTYWKKGDLFLSLRHQSMVLLYRPATNRIIWYKVGPWIHQHDVDILDGHRISIFNNNARLKGLDKWEVAVSNEMMIYDFETQELTSPYREAFEKLDIKTTTSGLGKVINENEVFAEETAQGRLMQFDRQGNVIWQFVNRGEDGKLYRLNWSRLITREAGDKIRQKAENTRCND